MDGVADKLHLLDNIGDTTAWRQNPPLSTYPFLDHHLDALTEPFKMPVPAIVAVPLQTHLVNAFSAKHCGSPRKRTVPLAFAVHMACVAPGVLLLPAVVEH